MSGKNSMFTWIHLVGGDHVNNLLQSNLLCKWMPTSCPTAWDRFSKKWSPSGHVRDQPIRSEGRTTLLQWGHVELMVPGQCHVRWISCKRGHCGLDLTHRCWRKSPLGHGRESLPGPPKRPLLKADEDMEWLLPVWREMIGFLDVNL